MSHAALAIVFALAAASAPRALASSIQLLDGPHIDRTRSWRFVGGQGVALLAAAAVVVVVSRTVIALGAAPSERIDTSDVVLGALILASLVIGAVDWQRRGRRIVLLGNPLALTPPQCLGVGARLMATNAAALLLFVAAINELVLNGGRWLPTYLLLLSVLMLVLLPSMLPPALEALAPNSVDRMLPGLFRWATTTGPLVSGALIAASGGLLLVRGFVG